jgi:hypothetical protein
MKCDIKDNIKMLFFSTDELLLSQSKSTRKSNQNNSVSDREENFVTLKKNKGKLKFKIEGRL